MFMIDLYTEFFPEDAYYINGNDIVRHSPGNRSFITYNNIIYYHDDDIYDYHSRKHVKALTARKSSTSFRKNCHFIAPRIISDEIDEFNINSDFVIASFNPHEKLYIEYFDDIYHINLNKEVVDAAFGYMFKFNKPVIITELVFSTKLSYMVKLFSLAGNEIHIYSLTVQDTSEFDDIKYFCNLFNYQLNVEDKQHIVLIPANDSFDLFTDYINNYNYKQRINEIILEGVM